jgi:hypothetical protein
VAVGRRNCPEVFDGFLQGIDRDFGSRCDSFAFVFGATPARTSTTAAAVIASSCSSVPTGTLFRKSATR